MLKEGPALGAAIRAALKTIGLEGPKAIGREFGVKPPSVSGWFSTGRISKSNLIEVIQRTQGKVPLNHWGDERAAAVLLEFSPVRASDRRGRAPHDLGEARLLKIYRRLDARSREKLLAYADGLADRSAPSPKQTDNAG